MRRCLPSVCSFFLVIRGPPSVTLSSSSAASDVYKRQVLVECMSNLLANECFGEAGKPDDIFDGCMKLYSECRHLVIVTNEVFSDGCEYDAGTTDYIRRLGEINVRLSRAADAVVEVVYSIPVFLKGDIGDVDN